MSHKATSWAMSIRGIKPAEFRVLMALADCHNPARGCFPSGAYLRDACEMPNGTLYDTLRKLEEKGHIRRVARGNKAGGGRSSTYYILGFEGELIPETGNNVESEKPETRGGLIPKTGEVDSGQPETEPVREPVSIEEPVNNDFDAFWEAAPRKVGKGAARRAYAKALKLTDHHTIFNAIKAYARSRVGQDPQFTVHPATWLNQERWTDDDTQPASFLDRFADHFAASGQDAGSYRGSDGISAPMERTEPGRSGEGRAAEDDRRGYQQEVARLIRPKRLAGSSG